MRSALSVKQKEPAETAVQRLCDVPMLSKRLDLLFTIREFPVNFEGVKPSLDLAWEATRELKFYEGIVEVLQIVLAIGNYLNAGSRQGGAYGFKLSALPKLAECFGQDRKFSLLHYLIQQLHVQRPPLLKLPEALECTSKASEISITGILAELEVMQKELDKIERFGSEIAEKSKMDQTSANKLLTGVKEFVSRYREQLYSLDTKGREMDEAYRELLSQFGEPLSTDSEDFFSVIAMFINQFKRISLELLPPVKSNPSTIPKITSVDVKETPTMTAKDTIKPRPLDEIDYRSVDTDSKKQPSSNPATLVVSKSPLSRTIRSVKLKPKDGTLEKQTKTGKKWNSRFFELEASKLHYYERKGGKYCDTIRLSSTTPVTIDVSDTRVIEIKTDSRLWYLRAESEGSASEWVAALKSHCQGINR